MSHLNFYDLNLSDMEQYLRGLGKEKFRAQQLFRWVYGQSVEEFSQMTNLSKKFRDELPSIFQMNLPKVVLNEESKDGTRKYLFDVGEGKTIESVLIPSKGRLTLCVSSEIGCNLACSFCLTGQQKLKRRLSVSEIVGQFAAVSKDLPEDTRISNIVFMGMGEPLDNSENVFKAIEILHSPWGFNLSRKKITVSTAGLVPQIPLITEAGVRLAVSLNGVNDEVRSFLMPINKRWPLKVLLEACKTHARDARDRVTFEYILIKGVTDSLNDATKLHQITRDIPCKINIIPFNEHPCSEFKKPSEKQIQAFQNKLIGLGTHVLRRKTMGDDISAACGQLTSAHQRQTQQLSL